LTRTDRGLVSAAEAPHRLESADSSAGFAGATVLGKASEGREDAPARAVEAPSE